MVMKFVNRDRELSVLKNRLESNKFELIIIFGRRRVGKTRLILEAVKNKNYIYYLATERNNIRKFKEVVSNIDKNIKYVKDDWEAIFNFLKDKIIIIDEFPNMILEDKTILSELQRIVDTILINTKTKIILSGSSISMMKSKILTYKSPLYGRSTSIMEIKPMKFFEISGFFQKISIEELIKVYGFTDGIPYYLEKVSIPFFEWLEKEIRKEDSFLKYEVDILLRTEFDEPYTYKEILCAIALGKVKLNEIRDWIGIKGEITPYLKNLIRVGLIEKVIPVTEKKSSKKGRYFINDNFLRFWFRYIYPNLSMIEEGVFDIETIKKDYNSYLGFIFEKVCKQFLIELIKNKKLPMFNKIGKQWGNIPEKKQTYEIDIVALNNHSKEILFCECKWKENIDPERICKDLIENKIPYVNWYNNERKEYIAIFAKSFKEKINEYEGRRVYCFDLKDLEQKILSKI